MRSDGGNKPNDHLLPTISPKSGQRRQAKLYWHPGWKSTEDQWEPDTCSAHQLFDGRLLPLSSTVATCRAGGGKRARPVAGWRRLSKEEHHQQFPARKIERAPAGLLPKIKAV
ncbi:hypothetical protein SUGI_0294840 [Cryptomeria japonica]|nr:hypothetical protein SUGI_0294840 [Cryptomeria japonica]